jgi:hypothetical protein
VGRAVGGEDGNDGVGRGEVDYFDLACCSNLEEK